MLQEEISSLEDEAKRLRTRVADGCLIEEKVERMIGDLESQIDSCRLNLKKFLHAMTQRVNVSNSLMNLLGMKRREQAINHHS